MKFFDERARQREIGAIPPDLKLTGIAGITTPELVELVYAKRAFPQSFNPVIQVNSWAYMIKTEALMTDDRLKAMRNLLQSELKGSNLIELGVGEQFDTHKTFFTTKFGVQRYVATERRPVPKREGLIESDLLEALSNAPTGKLHVCAFGVLNEPLCPHHWFKLPAKSIKQADAGHLEHEYLRRLARELKRVIPAHGLLFGDGFYPLRNSPNPDYRTKVFRRYLEAHGFEDALPVGALDRFNKEVNADAFVLKNSGG